MNKLIREFERESGIEIYGLGKDRASWEQCLEKFAQMIADECASVAERNQAEDMGWDIGGIIREHFGVAQ